MLRARGDLDGAVKLFEQLIKIDPRNLPAHLNRANINIAEGKFKTADEDLDPILKALPNNFMANYLRALEVAKQQQYAAADRIFDRISPRVSQILVGLLPPGGGKNGPGTIRPGREHTCQRPLALARRPAVATTDGQRRITAARSVASDRIFEAAG